MSRRALFAAALAVAPLFASSVACADTLGVANDYNVFVLHNMTQSYTDAEGKVGVGNNLTVSGYTVASKLSNGSANNLVVGGTFTQTGGTVHGSAVVGGNASLSNASVNGNFATGGSLTQTGGTVTNAVVTKGDYTVTNAGPGSAIVGGNFSQTGGNIPGNVTVGGNATLSNGAGGSGHYQVNGNLTTNNPGNVSGGVTYAGSYTSNVTWFPHTHGSAVTVDTSSYTALPISFDDAANYLTSHSSFWGSLSPNATAISSAGHLTLTGSDASLNIFSVNASQLLSGISFDLSVPTGSTALINILGTTVNLTNFGFNFSGIDAEHVLFNLAAATTVNISGVGIKGSLLAPNAVVNFNNANIDGTLVAYDLSGNGESHLHLFKGDLPNPTPTLSGPPAPPAVPLPASATAGAALLSLLVLRRNLRSC